MGTRKARGFPCGLALCWLLSLGAPALAQQSAEQKIQSLPGLLGGEAVLRPAWRGELGSYPRVVVQTVPGSQVTATVLAIGYRGRGEEGDASAAHLLEHLLFRSRSGLAPGALLVRAENLGGQSRAYLNSTTMVFAEMVPAEHGLESLGLQLERLRAVPSDAMDLRLEKQAVAREVAALGKAPEETARRELLAELGVDARVEGDPETLSSLKVADLEKLLDGLSLEENVMIAVVGPHTNQEVGQYLARGLQPLRPIRAQGRASFEPLAAKSREVDSPGGYNQRSFFLSLPSLSTADLMVAGEILKAAAGGRVALTREGEGLYRLDLSPAPLSDFAQRLGQVDTAALVSIVERSWLDLYESPLERAEMMALEALEHGSLSRPPTAAEMPAVRQRLVDELKEALPQAPSLLLRPGGEPREGLYPFQMTARASAEMRRETLSNGLSMTWQELRGWPVVAISGFFRLRRPLAPYECSQLETKLQARSTAGLQYEAKPDALFFHLWCPASELTATLAAAAAEIRELSESATLVDAADPAWGSEMEDFFLGRTSPTGSVSGSLLSPQGGQLVIVGEVDPVALEHGLRPSWSGWFKEQPPRAGAVQAPASSELSRTVPLQAGQSPLLLLGVWGPNRSSPDFLAFNLAVQTLAGRPTTSLLARQLRDSEGLVETLSVFPMSGSDRPDGSQLWLFALRPRLPLDDAAPLAARVQGRLAALGQEALAEAELERTRRFLLAALKLSTATPRGRARVLANAEFYRLSEQYSSDYAGLYDRIEAAQVKAVCAKYLLEQNPRWLYFRPVAPE